MMLRAKQKNRVTTAMLWRGFLQNRSIVSYQAACMDLSPDAFLSASWMSCRVTLLR
jgi:hypothetical protein